MRKLLLNRSFVSFMAVWTILFSLPPSNAFAFPTQSMPAVVQTASVREAQIDRIVEVLSHPEAQIQLRLAGINSAELKDSLTRLDDAELTQAAKSADAVRVAGNGAGLIIFILLVVLLVVLIAKLMDKKIVVKDT